VTPRRIVGLVLAAGAGTRFGGAKLQAPIGGRPVVEHVLRRLRDGGIEDVVIVLGDDADALEASVEWGTARRVRNPEPSRGLSSTVRIGIDALAGDVDAVVIALGDQPAVPVAAIDALRVAPFDVGRPIVVPGYADDRGRNPVRLERPAFGLVGEMTGDRGLGPVIAAHPDLVRQVPVEGDNPDVDTHADLVRLLEARWAARVRDNRDQVDRHREVPDGTDFYAPVTSLFRADPTRTDEPALEVLRSLEQPGDTWLDIGAGAGRYALPIARDLAAGGGSVIALDPSAGMLDGLREIAGEFGIENVRVVQGRWPPDEVSAFAADVSLMAHVGYDIEAIGPFVAAMEAATRRWCVAILMERQPSSIADVCWPPVHGEARIPLPALPDFVELLEAMGRTVDVRRLEREPRRFGDRAELEGFLRRQLWIEPGGEKDQAFRAALDDLIETDAEGRVGLVGQAPLPIGIVIWSPSRG
jgi:CTP:molybdopterin cytidylyltransferase MocA